MPHYKVTFPHMGESSIAFKSLLDELGFDAVIPPPITKETLSLGSRFAPEFACLPLKINIGNFLETIPQNIDVIFMAGGVGPCRFGLYGEVQKEILLHMGHELSFIILEPPKKHLFELFQTFTRFLGNKFWKNLLRASFICWEKIAAMDAVNKKILTRSPFLAPEFRRRMWQEKKIFLKRLEQATEVRDIRRLRRDTEQSIDSFPESVHEDIIKVMMLGEIYVVLEPAANFNLEENLNLMGVYVEKTIYLSQWIREQLFCNLLRIDWQKSLREAAKPYLTHFVGGHGLESVAHTVQAAQRGFDGVIQLAPLGCMPELIAMNMLNRIGSDYRIPVLSLVFDEHTSGTGVMTRLEAFIDLMKNKKGYRLIHPA